MKSPKCSACGARCDWCVDAWVCSDEECGSEWDEGHDPVQYAPPDEQDPRQIPLRVPPSMLKRINERHQQVGLSRNAWLVKALDWALSQPVKETTVRTTERV